MSTTPPNDHPRPPSVDQAPRGAKRRKLPSSEHFENLSAIEAMGLQFGLSVITASERNQSLLPVLNLFRKQHAAFRTRFETVRSMLENDDTVNIHDDVHDDSHGDDDEVHHEDVHNDSHVLQIDPSFGEQGEILNRLVRQGYLRATIAELTQISLDVINDYFEGSQQS